MAEMALARLCAVPGGLLTMLALAIFVMAVFGLAVAIAVLKFGRYFLGQGQCTKKECADPGHPLEKRKGLGRIPYVGDLFYCPPCLSFWFGMACSAWFVSPASQVVGVWWKAMLLDGLVACAASYVLHMVVERVVHGLEEV